MSEGTVVRVDAKLVVELLEWYIEGRKQKKLQKREEYIAEMLTRTKWWSFGKVAKYSTAGEARTAYDSLANQFLPDERTPRCIEYHWYATYHVTKIRNMAYSSADGYITLSMSDHATVREVSDMYLKAHTEEAV